MLATLRTTNSSPGLGVENHLRRDARIAAADNHDLRLLPALGQFAVTVLLVRQPAAGEGVVAIDQSLRKGHRQPRCALPKLLAIEQSEANVMPESAFFASSGRRFMTFRRRNLRLFMGCSGAIDD